MAQQSKTKKTGAKKPFSSFEKKNNPSEKLKGILAGKDLFASKNSLAFGLAAVIIIAIIVAVVVSVKKPSINRKATETIVTKNELKEKLNVDIKDPVEGSGVSYGIENGNIAKMSYTKTVSDGKVMNFVLRTSSSTEEIENNIGVDAEFLYAPILMNVVCSDGSEVPVESKIALEGDTENIKYMKALWYDNDKYYSMVTDNLVTREDFLQEVNRVIIANHEEF